VTGLYPFERNLFRSGFSLDKDLTLNYYPYFGKNPKLVIYVC